MRKLILIMFSAIGIAQTNPTSFSKIKVTNQTENNSAGRIVVQDAGTKEFHWIDKNSISAGSSLNLQQVSTNGNEITNQIIINKDNASGFIHKVNGFSGGIKTHVTSIDNESWLEVSSPNNSGVTTYYSPDVIVRNNGLNTFQLTIPFKTGTLAIKEELGQMPSSLSTAALPLNNAVPAGSIYYVSGTGQTFVNNGTTWIEL